MAQIIYTFCLLFSSPVPYGNKMKSISISYYILIIFICNLPLMLTNITIGNDEVADNYNETVYNSSSLDHSEKQDSSMDESSGSVLEPSVNIEFNIDMVIKDLKNNKQPLSIIRTDNSEISKDILNNDSPVVVAFSGSSTVDLEQPLNTSIASAKHSLENRTSTTQVPQEQFIENATGTITTAKNTAILMSDNIHSKSFNDESADSNIQRNITENSNEDIPSFSEWAQKRLEEVEKNEQVNSTSKGQTINGKGSSAKLRWKNYASLDCGAKVIAANPESISPGAILSPSNDEYKLNTCTSRIWFIVELCEAIQTKKIDLANYELFSSSPKDFTVSVSDRYPTRDWSIIGKFTAKDERDIQSFDLDTNIFGKYIKIEIKSHYGSEHYCPISLFRAFGTSVFEVLQKEDPAHVNRVDDDDDNDDSDDEDDHNTILDKENGENQKNLFSSATDAVMSIVKRAAEVLGNKVNNQSMQEKIPMNDSSLSNICSTPRYMIYCNNCNDTVFEQIYELISCKGFYVRQLVEIPLIYKVLTNSVVCKNYSLEFKTYLHSDSTSNSFMDYIVSIFPFKYIGAMCNEILILENCGILNISQQFSNATENISNEINFNLKIKDPHINKFEEMVTSSEGVNGTALPDLPYLNNTNKYRYEESNIKHITFLSQIKPTRALTTDMELSKTYNNLNNNQSSEKDKSFEETSTETLNLYSSANLIEPGTEMDLGSEGMDVLDDHLEHFISEFNGDYTQNTASSPVGTTNSPHAQKESIFLRLSNRIKVLERNMSLSSQYLEELSRRYKKQVEEMQNLLEKTIITLREESRKKDVRNKQLEDRLDNLTAMMESVITERHSWFITIYWFIFSMFFLFSLYFFCRKYSTYCNSTTDTKETTKILCCKSIDVVAHNSLEKNVRRPSDQALKIVHCSVVHNEEERGKVNQRKRKKKYMLRRSNSISNIKDNKYTYTKSDARNTDWVEKNHQVIEDIPFVLDESDHSTLEAYPLENEMMKVESHNYIDPTLSNTSYSSYNENGVNVFEKISVEESGKNKSSSNSVNNIADSIEPVKKEKKSFKKLFKKVF